MAGVSFYNLPAVSVTPSLLLDTYTGAAAAYSLRKLRTAYTGSAIRVRRASDNAEQDIGFVGEDLNTAALNLFCTGTDGFITTWYDQSNTNDAIRTTAAGQPKIYDSSTGVLQENGKPAIHLTGSISMYLVCSTAIYTGTTHRSTFTIAKRIDTTVDSIYGIGANTGAGTFYTATVESAVRVNGNVIFSSSSQITQSLATFIFNGTTTDDISCHINGVSKAISISTSTIINTSLGTSIIGGASHINTQNLKGTLQELIFYSNDQSSNRTAIETNINNYYNIYP